LTWVKVDDQLPHHEAWVGAPDVALGAWLRATCYSAERKLDGNVPKQFLRLISRQAREELLERGRLHPPGNTCGDCVMSAIKHGGSIRDDHYYIHGFLEYNPSQAKIEEERAAARARMQSARAEQNGRHAT
jgi:hypothetical protein